MNVRHRYPIGEPLAFRQRNNNAPGMMRGVTTAARDTRPRRDYVYWQPPPPPTFAAPAPPRPAATAARMGKAGESVMVEQLPSPISHIPTLSSSPKKSSSSSSGQQKPLRPRMGVGVSMGVTTKSSTPKTSVVQPSRNHPLPNKIRGEIANDANDAEACDPDDEPIYCEIAKGDTPTKTPPSLKPTNRRGVGGGQQHKPAPVQRRNFPTVNRANHLHHQHRSQQIKPEMNEKRLARDFSHLRITEEDKDVFKKPSQLRPTRERRISCDFNDQQELFYQDPFQAKRPIGMGRDPMSTLGNNSNMTASRLGRRAVTQVELALPSTRHFQARQQQYHDQVFNRLHAAPSGWPNISRDPVGGGGDSEFRRDSSSSSTARRNRLEQQPRHVLNGAELCSEYGFNNFNLDDTASTATGTLTGTESSVCGDPSASIASSSSALRKGLLWQQRDKMFSRWKERFFILTPDYLQCFKKGTSRITEMGGFIFKLRLSEVEDVELIDKKGYLTVSLTVSKDGSKILLRKPEGIRDWFESIKKCSQECRGRRGMMKTTNQFWAKKQFTDSSSMEQYILARKRIEMKYAYSETESCVSGRFAGGDHLRELSKSNLNMTSRRNPVTTTDYGFIDLPFANIRGSRSELTANNVPSGFEDEGRSSISPTSSDFAVKKLARDTSSTFSHDSGVDSMNTNSSGSVLSHPTPSIVSGNASEHSFGFPRGGGGKLGLGGKQTSKSNLPRGDVTSVDAKSDVSRATSNSNSDRTRTSITSIASSSPRKSMIPRHKPVRPGTRPNREELLRNISLV